MTGVEEGLLPHYYCADELEEVEQERRLLYVAMTRAKTRLHLSCAAQRRRFGTYESSPPSPFLDELPSEVIHEDGRGPQRAAFGSRAEPGWG